MHRPPDEDGLLDDLRELQVRASQARNGGTVLHVAAAVGHVEAIRILMTSGIPVDAVDADGDTALHVAAQAGHEVVARALLDAGASCTTVGAFGHSASRRAEVMGHRRLARLLQPSADRGVRRGWWRRLWPL